MANDIRWEIRGNDGVVKARVGSLEYNDEWMSERYVTVTVESPCPIDFAIGDYLIYRDERFEINYDPGKIKSAPQYKKGDAFKYENVKFNSLADELTRCDFLDVVPGDNQLHFTGLPKFSFYGGVKALADRIQANLDRAYGEGAWEVILGAEAPTQSQINNPTPSGSAQSLELNVAVDNIKVAGALEILVNQFKTYYTIKGRTITIGAAGVPADHLFKYGKGNGLYEIEENAEADQAIVTRLRAYGSTRNIPHRYYNSLSDADADGVALVPDNMAVQYLMLPSFPYDTLDPYIDSANISALGVREGTIFFDGSGDLEEIYPSIEGMTAEELKASGVSCQSSGELDVLVSAEQMSDDGVGVVNDQRSTTNDQGASGAGYEGGGTTTAEPATFKVTIKDIGFDINEHLTSEAAKISFKSGMLGAREFEIVSCERLTINDQLSGYELELNRVYDEDIKLWFPYKDYNAKEGDKFVLLSIRMPEVYIKAAAQRLKERATEWLSKNDYSRSVYAPKIDENFMARQHDAAMASSGAIKSLHDTLCAGMQLLFEDEDLGIDAAIFIDRLTIIEGEGPVPTYEVVLKEEKTVGRLDKMQNQIDSLAAGYGQGGGYNASQIRSLIAAYGGAMFLSKLKNDRTPYQISSDKGFEVGHFTSGVSGGYFGLDKDGESFAEVGRLWVRVKAFFEELTVIKSSVLAGKQYITPGGGIKCVKVSGVRLQASEEEEEIFLDSEGGRNDLASLQGGFDSYRCYFLSEQDGEETDCKFIVGDQAISESFNAKEGTYNKISNHFYWRAVTEVNNDAYTDENGNHYGYIELSATNCASNSDIPQAGDEICQLGYQGNQASGVSSQFSERQSAMVFSTVDSDSPSMKLFDGINSFSLNDKAIISFGRDNRGVYFRLGNSTATQYFNYSQEEGLKIAGDIIALSTIDGKSLSQYFTDLIPEFEITREDIEEYVNAIVDPRIEGIQDQIDGVIETWFYNGVPTLTNYPASEWDENAKIAHLGDLYYDNTTGTAYRFSKDGNGDYYWNTITDDAITKALAAAKDAQDTADQKRRTFLAQPTPPYDEGDIWVNATYGTQYSNDILRCITPKEKGQSFSISDWTLASKYTDDSALNNFIGSYQGTIGDILNQLDGKAETWYQATDPSTAWTTAEVKLLHKGDLWYNTTNGTTWYWNGTQWEQQNIPKAVFDTIDGKADIFVSKSELMAQGYHANDLWFLEADYTLSDGLQKAGTLAVAKCGRSASEMASNGFHFEDWAKKDRYTDDTLAQQAKDEIGKYEYIKKALHGVSITSGGLFLSSFVQLGEWSHNAGTDEWTMSHIWSGLNGIYNDNPRSPFLWGGGDMVDIFDNDNNRKSVLPESYAKAMIRMDGSAYFGGGAHAFNADGTGWLGSQDNGIKFNGDGTLELGSGIKINLNTGVAGLKETIESFANMLNFIIPVRQDGTQTQWGASDMYAVKSVKGFYSEEFISARGINANASGGGATALSGLSDVALSGLASGQALVYNGSEWVNQAISSVGGLDETQLAQYLSEHNYVTTANLSGYATTSSLGSYLLKSGGTMTGVLHLLGSQSADTANTGSLNLNNSDIYGVNSIKFADLSDSAGEGLQWYRDATHIDSFWVANGVMYFTPNRTWGGTATNNVVLHSGNISSYAITSHQSLANYVTLNGIQTISGAKTFGSNIHISHAASADMSNATTNPMIKFSENGIQAVGLVYTDFDAYRPGKGLKVMDVDGSDAVNVWLEVQGNAYASAFVKNGGTSSQFLKADGSVDGNTYALSSSLGNYLPLTGGTLTGKLTIKTSGHTNQLTIHRNDVASAATILYTNNDGELGGIGIGGSASVVPNDTFYFKNNTSYRIWHAGNDGSGSGLDADTVDGVHNGSLTANLIKYNNNGGIDSAVQFMQKASGWNTWDAPTQNWYSVIKLNHGNGDTYYNRVLAFDFFSNRIYTNKMQDGAVNGWSALAFTSDNVASATKLQNTRYIWGQNFNGEGNVNGTLHINAPAGSYVEGIRIHESSAKWCTICLCGDDNTGDSGTSAKTWGIFNNDGNFYINKGASSTAQAPRLWGHANGWTVGNSSTTSYALNAASFICDSWIRTIGATGWYNETYGGGWYMTDGTWIRTYNSKSIYASTGTIRTDGEFQIGGNGDKFRVTSGGTLYAKTGIYSDGYVTARGQNSSDARLKEDIRDFNASEIIKALKPKQFRWNAYAKSKFEIFRTDEVQYGLIAQETKPVASWLVDEDMFGDGLWGVKYEKLIPILVKAENEQIFRIDDLEVRVKRLEKENGELRRKIEILERR